jgi:hypothetical protein
VDRIAQHPGQTADESWNCLVTLEEFSRIQAKVFPRDRDADFHGKKLIEMVRFRVAI